MQTNYITKNAYTGSNQDSLAHQKIARHYQSNEWLTYIQAKSVGRNVIHGQHGVKLVKFAEEEEGGVIKRTFAKTFTVFNLDQTELTAKEEEVYG